MSKGLTVEQIVDKFKRQPHYIKSGAGKLSRRWKCTKEDIYEARRIVRSEKKTNRLPKILIFDIESSPSIVYSFGRFGVNIGLSQVIQDPIMLTWSAKWLFGDKVMSDRITSEEVKRFDDYRIVKSLWDLVNTADIVVAHFGLKFDVPLLNARAIINKIPPFSFVQIIDTKKISSMNFKFPSNKLDALATYFGIPNKIKTDFDLWARCMAGNEDALFEMNVYCDQDVRTLEEVYLRLRPYAKGHPNVGLYLESDEPVCSHCGSSHLTVENKDYYTPTGRYSIYRCECGALSRCRSHNMDTERLKSLVVSVAK